MRYMQTGSTIDLGEVFVLHLLRGGHIEHLVVKGQHLRVQRKFDLVQNGRVVCGFGDTLQGWSRVSTEEEANALIRRLEIARVLRELREAQEDKLVTSMQRREAEAEYLKRKSRDRLAEFLQKAVI